MEVVAYAGPYVPPEWIEAHGFTPERLNPRASNSIARMGACPYADAFAKDAAGRTDLRAVVMTTMCDQMRRMHEVLETEAPFPVFLMHTPATWTDDALLYYAQEIKRLGRFLVRIGGMFDRDHLRHLLATRPPLTLSPDSSAIRVGLVGAPVLPDARNLYSMVDAAGGSVVFDATETGLLSQPAAFDPARASKDPAAVLATAYFEIPHPFRRPNDRFYLWLRDLVHQRRVRGLIVTRQAWCDGWNAEIATIKERLLLPVAVVAADSCEEGAAARTRNQVAALLETLHE